MATTKDNVQTEITETETRETTESKISEVAWPHYEGKAQQEDIDNYWKAHGYPDNINGRNRQGYTRLVKAMLEGNEDLVCDLLDAGANPNKESRYHPFYKLNTPLYIACFYNLIGMVRILLCEQYICLRPFSDQELSALEIALSNNNPYIVKLLIKAGENIHSTKTPEPEQVFQVYQRLKDIITKEFKTAKLNSKKFMIVLGETHDFVESSLLKTIVMLIMKDLSILNHFQELDPERLKSIEIEFEQEKKSNEGLDKDRTVTHPVVRQLDYVKKLDMKLHLIDLAGKEFLEYKDDRDEDLQAFYKRISIRDERMVKEIVKENEDGMVVVGAAHLKGILENFSKHQDYHVFPINISAGLIFNSLCKRETFAFSEVFQPRIHGNYNRFSDKQFDDLIERALLINRTYQFSFENQKAQILGTQQIEADMVKRSLLFSLQDFTRQRISLNPFPVSTSHPSPKMKCGTGWKRHFKTGLF